MTNPYCLWVYFKHKASLEFDVLQCLMLTFVRLGRAKGFDAHISRFPEKCYLTWSSIQLFI